MDVPAGVKQEEGHAGIIIHLPSAVRALVFPARRIQPFLSLVDREVEFCVLMIYRSPLAGLLFVFFVRKGPSYRDSNSRPNVTEGFEVTLNLNYRGCRRVKGDGFRRLFTLSDGAFGMHASGLRGRGHKAFSLVRSRF